MRKVQYTVLGLAGLLLVAQAALAQSRPYIGFAYPAGGQQGTKFEVRLGGQNVDDVEQVRVTGTGVMARVVECRRRLNPQEMQLLNEQLRILRRSKPGAFAMAPMMSMEASAPGKRTTGLDRAAQQLVTKIEERQAEYVPRPACAAIANIVIVEVTVARDAAPGRRELTVANSRWVSNPIVFHVGQLPEVSRKPMLTAHFQVLGKEKLALRKRPDEEIEQRVSLPCTLNGQIASGEVNRYRFKATKGQKLVISAEARQLVPFVADAVPGWFQPVMALYDPDGKEVAYDDDYRFKPDPVILYEVPKDGVYALTITDAIYRGREDFVYRISMGELPFITGVFPLGAQVGAVPRIELKGWNLEDARLVPPAGAEPGVFAVAATRRGQVSNTVPFKLSALPEALEQEPNNEPSRAQKVELPIVANGRIHRPDDWDVFEFTGKAGQTIVAEVEARRLESPLDSFVKITDASGKVLAFNDDIQDPESGDNTHDADSYVTLKLPASGTYFVHVGDSSRHGGDDYAYRLRISPPQPDFALRIAPSSLSLRSRNSAQVNLQVIRKEGFNAPIQLSLKDPPAGFTAVSSTITPGQGQGRLTIKTERTSTNPAVALRIEGRAKVGDRVIVHDAVGVEDRMQAFLWRHYVPAQDLSVLVYDPSYERPPKRPLPTVPPAPVVSASSTPPTTNPAKPMFTKQQVASRLRQLKTLYEDGLLTESFYCEKVAECEAAR